jgi:hypothetical protein
MLCIAIDNEYNNLRPVGSFIGTEVSGNSS